MGNKINKEKLIDIKFREVSLIEKEIKRLREIIDKKMEQIDYDDISSFNDFENIAVDERRKLSELSRRKRMIMTYKLKDVPEYGDVFDIEDFISMCKDGGFVDYDGHGNYALDDKMSDIIIYPSDVKYNSIRKGFNKVVWFNR